MNTPSYTIDDDPLCDIIVSNIWEDENYLVKLDDPLCSLDDLYLCGASIHNYDVEFTFDVCKYKRGRDKIPMLPYYLNCKLLIIICIGYFKVAANYSYIKCQCIGRELDLKVNGFMFYGVLHMLSNTIQFEHTFISFVTYKICLATVL
jgi:hypothetical protein